MSDNQKSPSEEAGKPVASMNTDRELWREVEGDYYAPSIHVTKSGGIGINVGGSVYVKPLREWHKLADHRPPSPSGEEIQQLDRILFQLYHKAQYDDSISSTDAERTERAECAVINAKLRILNSLSPTTQPKTGESV
jgi:hypothetical protein